MTATCGPQIMNWWSDKCGDCGHMLAAHRDVFEVVDGQDAPNQIPFANCALCEMQNELSAAIAESKAVLEKSIADQDTALRTYSEGLQDQAKDFAQTLQDRAKTYVDGKVGDLVSKIDTNQAAAKSYIDQKVTGVAGQMPSVVIEKVKPEALK